MFDTSAVDASSPANSIASDLVSAWPRVMASLSTSQFSPTGLKCNDFGLFFMSEDMSNGGVLIPGGALRVTSEGGAFPVVACQQRHGDGYKAEGDGAYPENPHLFAVRCASRIWPLKL